ncbi:uncharacterized protein MELLADRAFT_87329 [Melampsora larici-populina 98AG31]|uniref:Protein kinase domain-containing protein n=1 Tax=Melampsora larici-populina (strain 98AG31 / pathotype 3-4-7) TaxID=747676 RepID=F4RMV3_MELLP|nr:uncharacterized protein MELLADRAFT_87329 [Melampsora larici-populina 98AG31]EGG06178.1 hypothetical protein MELLADRAFT_87329 [Melampsora larici-populina 98AG31]
MVNQRDLLPNPIAPRDLLELQKDFRVVRKLDSGGFFTVFEAHSDYLGSVCALKIIPHIDQTGTNKQPVIQNELEILNSLKRIPFIIQVLGVQVYFHTTCIMFEFCNQGDLGEMVRQSRIPENLIKRYILDIGTALHHMHRRNIIHRDLKLDNILVDHMGNVKITAFGLATVCPFLGLTSGIVGSPWARAPEMLTRASYNNMVDWWSLGIMLFTMVTGTKPFEPSKYLLIRDNLLSKFTNWVFY